VRARLKAWFPSQTMDIKEKPRSAKKKKAFENAAHTFFSVVHERFLWRN